MLSLYTEVTCGGDMLSISSQVPEMISLIITLIKIIVPVLLIVFGMLDLGKPVMAQKEDEIKKAQGTFIKRLLTAALVFFVITISQVVIKLVAGSEGDDIWNCVDCFISGPSEKAAAKGGNCTAK